jgi:DNA-binding NarL/FixJ family response regulator
MQLHLVLATPSIEFESLFSEMLTQALELVRLDVQMEVVATRQALDERLALDVDDVIFLDWLMAEAETPSLIRSILARNPRLRVVALLPANLRPYREQTWRAGACNGLPKEYMDQEWMCSLLCLMWRAIEREQRLLSREPSSGGAGESVTGPNPFSYQQGDSCG